MKRFWLVLLSMGLIVAFCASAFAVDVKFSGSYYAAGRYIDKFREVKYDPEMNSFAIYYQKLQLNTEFVVAPGLSLVTQANIMQRNWSASSTSDPTLATGSAAATTGEKENIGFEYAYINYASPIGLWMVGYQNDQIFGTTFGDSSTPAGKIFYILPIGNFKVVAAIVKVVKNSLKAVNSSTSNYKDFDEYGVAGIYSGKNWEAGLLYLYYSNATDKNNTPTSNKSKFHGLLPYAKATLGPLAIQAELNYYFGTYNEYEEAGSTDQDLSSLTGFVDVLGTFGPVYIGCTFAYLQGQGEDTHKINTWARGGTDWQSNLILVNEELSGVEIYNSFLYQIRAGVKPTDKLDIGMAVAFAKLDTLSVGYVFKDYGWEIDVTGSYKITNNLSYMLGVGYFIPGNYHKGTTQTVSYTELANTYLIANKLALTF